MIVKSVGKSDKPRKIQIDSRVTKGCTKKFILGVKTRYNSLIYVVDRFLDMSKIASQLLLDFTDCPELFKQVVQLLQPFEFVTGDSSG